MRGLQQFTPLYQHHAPNIQGSCDRVSDHEHLRQRYERTELFRMVASDWGPLSAYRRQDE